MIRTTMAIAFSLYSFSWTIAQTITPAEYRVADSVFRLGIYDSAQVLFSHLLHIEKNDSLLAESLHRKGVMFFGTGESDSAIYFEARALDKFTVLKVRAKMSNAAGNLALIYSSKKIYDKSLFYNLAAIRDAVNGTDSLRQYFNLFTLYQVQNKFDSAFGVLVNHIRPFTAGLLPNQAFLTALNAGLYFSNIASHDSAIYYFKQSLPAALSSSDSTAAYNNVSDEFRLTRNYPRAVTYLDSALALTKANDNLEARLSCYDTYVSLYTDMHDYSNALAFAQLARGLSDTLFANGKANALLDAGVKYEAEKKEASIQLLGKDNLLKQRNLTFSLIGLLLLAVVVLLIFRNNRHKQKANAILSTQKAALESLTTELEKANQTKLLLLSTIGHDLRSPVSSLYAVLKMQEIKSGKETGAVNSGQVTTLLNTLENLLAWSKLNMTHAAIQPAVHRIDVYELMEDQLEFFSAKASSKDMVLRNLAADGLMVKTDEYILSTILRNLVDNAINHSGKGDEVFLDASNQANGLVRCAVRNRGTEAGTKQLEESLATAGVETGSHGLGLVLVKQFCESIKSTLEVKYKDGFTIVSLHLPNL